MWFLFAVAGIFGYISGKMSYMRVCQEKFMKLENSPLGEALRQGRLRHVPSKYECFFLGPCRHFSCICIFFIVSHDDICLNKSLLVLYN